MISYEEYIKICIPLCYLYIQVDRDKRNHAQVVGRFHYCGRGLRSIHGKPASGRKEISQRQNTIHSKGILIRELEGSQL